MSNVTNQSQAAPHSFLYAKLLNLLWLISMLAISLMVGKYFSANATALLYGLHLPSFLIDPLTEASHAEIITTLLGLLSSLFTFFTLAYLLQGLWDSLRLSLVQRSLYQMHHADTLSATSKKELLAKQWFYYPLFSNLWYEFARTLHLQIISEDGKTRNSYRVTESAENFFSERALVDTPMRVEFFRHLPGIMTGAGIVSTFAGILMGLNDFNPTVMPEEVTQQLKNLFIGVSTAFIASFYAIFSSILVTALEKISLHLRYSQIDRLHSLIHTLFGTGAESEYLANMANTLSPSKDQTDDQGVVIKEALDHSLSHHMKTLSTLLQTHLSQTQALFQNANTAQQGQFDQLIDTLVKTKPKEEPSKKTSLQSMLDKAATNLGDKPQDSQIKANETLEKAINRLADLLEKQDAQSSVERLPEMMRDSLSPMMTEQLKHLQSHLSDQQKQTLNTLKSEESSRQDWMKSLTSGLFKRQEKAVEQSSQENLAIQKALTQIANRLEAINPATTMGQIPEQLQNAVASSMTPLIQQTLNALQSRDEVRKEQFGEITSSLISRQDVHASQAKGDMQTIQNTLERIAQRLEILNPATTMSQMPEMLQSSLANTLTPLLQQTLNALHQRDETQKTQFNEISSTLVSRQEASTVQNQSNMQVIQSSLERIANRLETLNPSAAIDKMPELMQASMGNTLVPLLQQTLNALHDQHEKRDKKQNQRFNELANNLFSRQESSSSQNHNDMQLLQQNLERIATRLEVLNPAAAMNQMPDMLQSSLVNTLTPLLQQAVNTLQAQSDARKKQFNELANNLVGNQSEGLKQTQGNMQVIQNALERIANRLEMLNPATTMAQMPDLLQSSLSNTLTPLLQQTINALQTQADQRQEQFDHLSTSLLSRQESRASQSQGDITAVHHTLDRIAQRLETLDPSATMAQSMAQLPDMMQSSLANTLTPLLSTYIKELQGHLRDNQQIGLTSALTRLTTTLERQNPAASVDRLPDMLKDHLGEGLVPLLSSHLQELKTLQQQQVEQTTHRFQTATQASQEQWHENMGKPMQQMSEQIHNRVHQMTDILSTIHNQMAQFGDMSSTLLNDQAQEQSANRKALKRIFNLQAMQDQRLSETLQQLIESITQQGDRTDHLAAELFRQLEAMANQLEINMAQGKQSHLSQKELAENIHANLEQNLRKTVEYVASSLTALGDGLTGGFQKHVERIVTELLKDLQSLSKNLTKDRQKLSINIQALLEQTTSTIQKDSQNMAKQMGYAINHIEENVQSKEAATMKRLAEFLNMADHYNEQVQQQMYSIGQEMRNGLNQIKTMLEQTSGAVSKELHAQTSRLQKEVQQPVSAVDEEALMNTLLQKMMLEIQTTIKPLVKKRQAEEEDFLDRINQRIRQQGALWAEQYLNKPDEKPALAEQIVPLMSQQHERLLEQQDAFLDSLKSSVDTLLKERIPRSSVWQTAPDTGSGGDNTTIHHLQHTLDVHFDRWMNRWKDQEFALIQTLHGHFKRWGKQQDKHGNKLLGHVETVITDRDQRLYDERQQLLREESQQLTNTVLTKAQTQFDHHMDTAKNQYQDSVNRLRILMTEKHQSLARQMSHEHSDLALEIIEQIHKRFKETGSALLEQQSKLLQSGLSDSVLEGLVQQFEQLVEQFSKDDTQAATQTLQDLEGLVDKLSVKTALPPTDVTEG
ncbi:hypothetical protein ACQZV8_09120 [Magnetococcales bacterium HHB-1]